MLVDTGSSVFLLSKEIYETLSFRSILTEVADTLTTATYCIDKGNMYFEHPIVNADLEGLSCILGLDFLSDNVILMGTCKGILMSSKFKIIQL